MKTKIGARADRKMLVLWRLGINCVLALCAGSRMLSSSSLLLNNVCIAVAVSG